MAKRKLNATITHKLKLLTLRPAKSQGPHSRYRGCHYVPHV